ncbi:MAG: sensor histidine kinase [Acidobacteriia bacterium]|nr:sensor histidine kinase [Terriglobia bacterium]
MDQIPGPASSATAWERLFLECDKQGRVLWMNQRARARLGPVESLFSSLPSQHVPEASKLIASRTENGCALLSSLQSADRPVRIPVRLVLLLSLQDRVVLSAEVRSRSADKLPRQHEILRVLLGLQSNAVRKYFRLLELEESLAGLRQSSRSVGARISQALETERTRLGRELHAGVGQALAGIKLHLELIARETPEFAEAARKRLDTIQLLTDQAQSEVRSVSQRWHSPDWQGLDLAGAIHSLWVTSGIPEKLGATRATLELHPVDSDLPDAVRFTVYRAAQEGLTNVIRHSGATEVRLELSQGEDQISLVLEDNGIGFDAREVLHGTVHPAMRGIGLRAMHDEVLGLGGRFEVRSMPGNTRLAIALPITENR